MLAMLHEVDAICRRHSIHYMLFAGTALGCIRHKGFIPWDDDLDIVMARREYDRFLQVAPKEIDSDLYYLQAEFSAHWPMFFTKLRKNGTACIEKYHPKDPLTHQGVYIDIFPYDNLSDNAVGAKLQFLASKIIIASSLDRRGYLTNDWKKKLMMRLTRVIPKKPFLRMVQERDKNDTKQVHVFLGAASRYACSVFPRAWLTETEPGTFEDGQFPVSAHAHALLTKLYGDYMRIPPEEERVCKVHSALTDLKHPYTQYLQWQREQVFSEYSRSIR